MAAEHGHADAVGLLLSYGADPRACEGLFAETPLHYAVKGDSLGCVELLLDAGVDVNAHDSHGESPLFHAKSRGVIERLSDAGADLTVISTRGQYPFQYCAAYIRSVEVMEFWLERGVPINHVPDFGWPALNAVPGMKYGIQGSPDPENDLRLLNLLIKHGADLNLSASGGTPLYDACMNWHGHLIEPLLAAGADPNVQAPGDKSTPLIAAVFRRTPAAVRTLLRYGADVNLANRHRKTPIELCEDDEIRALLEPLSRPAVHLLPTEEQVLRRLQAIPKFAGVTPQGCTEAEIDQLQHEQGVRFPHSYRRFLAVMGKGAGEFMISDRWYFRAHELATLTDDEDVSEYCDLPDDAFIFACRDGYVWVFFVADGSDDPPVYWFDDGEEKTYTQYARSVWEFVESLVIDYECWYGTTDELAN